MKDSHAPKVVLIVCSIEKGRPHMLEVAMKCLADIERRGAIAFAPCLQEVMTWCPRATRALEAQAIKRRYPDEVVFADMDAPDLTDLIELARQYQYLSCEAPQVLQVA